MTIEIEPGELTDGTKVHRWRCTECGRRGVWLEQLHNVETNGARHVDAMHQNKEAA